MTILIRTFMNSKIHRARVTESNLNYVGSITIDANILDAVDILPNEKVAIVNTIMVLDLKHMSLLENVVVERCV